MKLTSKGFTLIELLVVIAVLGVLAGVILIAINPLEQLARGRDAGRKNAIGQLANATQAYYTARNGTYIAESATWINGASSSLVSSGELKNAPAAIAYTVGGTAACTVNANNNYCYDLNTAGTEAIIYARLESTSESSKCASGTSPYFVWSSALARSCLVCSAAEPTAAGVTCNATQ
jgi:prepilin-type N-terminal cleavage/methylation domain-containing protein